MFWPAWVLKFMADVEREPMNRGLSWEPAKKGELVLRLSIPGIYEVRPVAMDQPARVRIVLDKDGNPDRMAIEK